MSDPFDLLNVPPVFPVDAAALQRAWLAASARLHPDRARAFSSDLPGTGGRTDSGTGAEADAEHAQRLAHLAALNRAKAVLADPIQRAEALLARLEGPSKESDKSLPDGFLMEMLDVREQVEEAAASKDPGAIAEWERWADERRAESVARVASLFQALARGEPAARAEIRRELNAWRYIERLIEQLPRD